MEDYHTTKQQIETFQNELIKAEMRQIKGWKCHNVFYWGKQLTFFILTVFFIISIIGIWMDKAAGRTPKLFGYQIYHIESGSMEPTLPTGSLIISSEISKEDNLNIGDVITYLLDDTLVTHRIVEVGHDASGLFYRTKGDYPFNDIDPKVVRTEQVVAKYRWSLPIYIHPAAEGKIEYGQR